MMGRGGGDHRGHEFSTGNSSILAIFLLASRGIAIAAGAGAHETEEGGDEEEKA
jgi:hypothetical protein